MSICVCCRAEVGPNDRFCAECGTRKMELVRTIESLPEEIRVAIECMGSMLDGESKAEVVSDQGNGTIMATGDVVVSGNQSDVSNMKIYSTGSVLFAPLTGQYFYYLKLSFGGNTMCEVPFVSAIAFRRERIGDEWRIKVYSDLKGESREVPREIMSGIMAQALSRKPVVVMRKNERLYVFTLNTKPYLMMDGKFIEANTVKQIRINDRMGVGCGSSMIVYRR